MEYLSEREADSSENKDFHLFTCPNVETFKDLDLQERVGILIRQDWSSGLYRQDLDYEVVYDELREDYLIMSSDCLSNLFLDNLDLLKSLGKIETLEAI